MSSAGAVMQFESDYGLTDDGLVGPTVWKALTQAVAARQTDASPYDYLVVSESIPEQLNVWRDGPVHLQHACQHGRAGRCHGPGRSLSTPAS